MSASSGPAVNPSLVQTLLLEGLIAALILYRSIRTYRGRVLSVARLVSFPILALLLWVPAEWETAITVPWTFPLWTAVDVGLVVLAAVATLPLAGRLLAVFRDPDGQWMYRYGIELISFYLAIWVLRLVLAVYFDPASLEFSTGPLPLLTATAAVAMQLVQALLSISTGLLVGRSVSTYRRYREAVQKAVPEPPLLA